MVMPGAVDARGEMASKVDEDYSVGHSGVQEVLMNHYQMISSLICCQAMTYCT